MFILRPYFEGSSKVPKFSEPDLNLSSDFPVQSIKLHSSLYSKKDGGFVEKVRVVNVGSTISGLRGVVIILDESWNRLASFAICAINCALFVFLATKLRIFFLFVPSFLSLDFLDSGCMCIVDCLLNRREDLLGVLNGTDTMFLFEIFILKKMTL